MTQTPFIITDPVSGQEIKITDEIIAAIRSHGWSVIPPMKAEDAMRLMDFLSPDDEPQILQRTSKSYGTFGAGTQSHRLLAAYAAAARTTAVGGEERGFTDQEAADWADLLSSCYWKRAGELRAGGLIEVVVDEDGSLLTRIGASGVPRIVSGITPAGRDYLSRLDQ